MKQVLAYLEFVFLVVCLLVQLTSLKESKDLDQTGTKLNASRKHSNNNTTITIENKNICPYLLLSPK